MQTNIKSFTSNQISCTTRYKGKEIAKPITPLSESASEEDSDPEQAQKDKDMQKNLALIAKYFKKLYKPTNNNLRTSSNTRNKNVDTNPRYKTNNQTGQFGNQRAVNAVGARETCSGPECRKPKRVRDSTYHKEKMLLCKQAEKGVQLQAEQSDWLADTDEEIDEQEFGSTLQLHGKDSNSIAALANLIANLKLDVDDNKKIQKQLKKANATLTQELTECKSILAETSRTLGESNSIRDSCLVALQNKTDRVCESCLAQKLSEQTDFVSKEIYTELLQRFARLEKHSISLEIALQECQVQLKNDTVCKERASNVFRKEREQYVEIQDLKAQLQDKNMAISELKKLVEKYKGKSVDTKFDKPSVVRQPNAQRIPKPLVLGKPAPFSDSLERKYFSKKKSVPKTNESEEIYVFLLENFLGNDLHPVIVDLISIQYPFKVETSSSTPICLLAKASPTQAWLWHRRLSHLNFDYINLLSKKDIVIGLPKLKYVKDQLCSSCEVSKAKRSSFKSKTVPSSKGRLNLLHMDLCGPMRLLSINGTNKSGLIVETTSDILGHSFSSKDETPEVLKDFLTMIQRNLQAPVISVRTDRGTEFLNKTLNAFFKEEGIEHQTSTPRTPEQNGVVERRNRTLVEAARTMLSASKLPLFFWAEAIATAAISKQINPHPQLHEKQHTTTLMTKTLKQTPSHLWLYMVPLTRDG
ncbi:retrovirus-related pol polyprotein from transposon TNT 1-94 [Tanacetum coccineum]